MDIYPSHIWVGIFKDNAPEDYFTDNSGSEPDYDKPMNLFSKEQGVLYFDYDFTEISYLHWKDAEEPRSFIDGHSYSDSYINKVSEICKAKNINKINVFIIADEDQFDSPRTVTGEGYHLEYLGLFNCKD